MILKLKLFIRYCALLCSFASLAAVPAEPAANAPMPQGTENKRLYSFHAEGQDLKSALAIFAQANGLNIVPDQDVTGQVTLDVRDLPLEKMMQALMEAHDFTWKDEGGLIRVRNVETRVFHIDYLRLSRKGMGQNSATLGSGNSGGGGGQGGGGGGSGGGGGGGGGGSGGGSGSGGSSSAFSASTSSINLLADNTTDFWKELTEELGFMLTPAGKSSLAINKTAGIIQITDRPSSLKKVEHYLASVDTSVHRQVEIEAKIYDVALSDQFQFGIDWVHLANAYGGTMGFGGATLPVAAGGVPLQDSALGGVNRFDNVGSPLGNSSTLVFQNFNTAAAVNALQLQGHVEVISKPRIRTLNNQTALIKVGVETPFFAQVSEILQSQSGNISTTSDQITSVTVGTILSITPQISEDDWISLDITPVLTTLLDTLVSRTGSGATAPVLDTKQASSLLRVRDGSTVVLGGLIQTQKVKNEKKIPLLGDIPWLGKLFTGTFRANSKKELVIFVTPTIVRDGAELPLPTVPEF